MKFKVDDSLVKAFNALTMQFQVNERVFTTATASQLLDLLELQFKQRSETVQRQGNRLTASGIEASFGSVNRKDVTEIYVQPTSDGFLVVADVKYRPSLWFWIISLFLLFTYVLWLIPIAFFLIQKKTVKEAIEDCFRNVKNEFSSNPNSSGKHHSVSSATTNQVTVADIERLGRLLKQGLVTQEEFDSQKTKLFGNSITQSEANSASPVLDQSPLIEGKAAQEAQLMFSQAREYVKNGQKEAAANTLKDLIKRFPETKVAARSREILMPLTKSALR